jgi:hypothetical protein
MSTGSIYRITCLSTGLSYVGQTRDTKTKAGKPYTYGITGRWNDHVSCTSSTPLGRAIQEYGSQNFNVDALETDVSEDRLDEREAYWIAKLNTCVPNGYNKMRHGRCRHRTDTSLAQFYVPTTVSISLRQIKRDGEPHLIYAYLTQHNGTEVRITFGQGASSGYADAVNDAKEFVSHFSVPVSASASVFNPDAYEYEDKLTRYNDITIQRIRVAKFNSMAAVYIDKDRICFGGKHVDYETAVEKAEEYAKLLHNRHPDAVLANDASKSATGGCS